LLGMLYDIPMALTILLQYARALSSLPDFVQCQFYYRRIGKEAFYEQVVRLSVSFSIMLQRHVATKQCKKYKLA
jgi:hypothetical protein